MATKITERRQFVVTGETEHVAAVLKGDGLEQRVDEWGEFTFFDEDGDRATARLRIEDVLRLGVLVRELMRRAGDERDFCNDHGLHVETSATKWRCPACVAAEAAEKAAKEKPLQVAKEAAEDPRSILEIGQSIATLRAEMTPTEKDSDAA